MQFRLPTAQTADEYVSCQGWQYARLDHCPLHPQGGCGFSLHGYYPRKDPPGTLIRRWYCLLERRTFSLLPDCFASQFPGTLDAIEEAVTRAEEFPTVTQAAAALRPDHIEEAGAFR